MTSIARLLREMPEGYEDACFAERAIERKRGIQSPGDLMMLALFHLLNGCSLMEISEIARHSKLGNLSDVAFMKRFEKCNGWFKWVNAEIGGHSAVTYVRPKWLEKYRVLAIDASVVTEKGRSARSYRLHFALDIFSMESVQYKITGQKIGESLQNFEMCPGDLMMGDRAYVGLAGMRHCLEKGGDFLLRYRKNSFKLFGEDDEEIDLLRVLRKLTDKGENFVVDIKVHAKGSAELFRICAARKPEQAIAETQKRLRHAESKSQSKMQPDTKELNEYFVVITSLPDEISAEQVLELYRYRWQVEIYFKRLKSILDFGELPKRRPESVMAWLNGKLMVALLMETIISKVDFSPSGQRCDLPEHMARDEDAAVVHEDEPGVLR
jgi:hypothetical protein